MPGFIDIRIIGDTAGVQSMLLHLENKLSPVGMGTFMKMQVEPFMKGRAAQRFHNEGDDAVGMWAPLKPATEMIRQQRGFGGAHPINRRTGELENYIANSTGDVTANPLGTTWTYPGTPATGELADKVETAQVGRSIPNTVPRPVLGMDERDLAAVLTMLAYEIQKP